MISDLRRSQRSYPVATDPRRGEIYWIDWSPGRGSEQTGLRPALVVSTDAGNLNPRYPNVIVACLTSRGRDDVLTHVRIEPSAGNGLTAVSHAKCEQVLTISKERLRERLGHIAREDLDRIGATLARVLDLGPFT